ARARAGPHGDPDAGDGPDQGPRPARGGDRGGPAGARPRAAGSLPVRHPAPPRPPLAGQENPARPAEDPPGAEAPRPPPAPPPGDRAPAGRRRLRPHRPALAPGADPHGGPARGGPDDDPARRTRSRSAQTQTTGSSPPLRHRRQTAIEPEPSGRAPRRVN